MLGLFLAVSCGGGPTLLPAASDIFDEGRSVLPHADAYEAGEKVAGSIRADRLDYVTVSGLSVRDVCSLGFEGAPIESLLSAEACLESEEDFAQRLEQWQLEQKRHAYAPSQLQDLLRKPTSDAAESQALGELQRSLPGLMALSAKAQVAGLPETPWDCVEDFLDTNSGLARDLAEQACDYSTRKPEKEERNQVLESLAAKSEQAAATLDSGARPEPDTESGQCGKNKVLPIAQWPYESRVALSSDVLYAIGVVSGESITVGAGMIGNSDPRIAILDSDCKSQLASDDDGGYEQSAYEVYTSYRTGTHYIRVDAYGSGSGSATLRISSDGAGGPSADQVAEAQAYLNWYKEHFAGLTREAVEKDEDGIWGSGSSRRDLVDQIILGSRSGEACVRAEYTDHEAITQVMLWDEALEACKTQTAAALAEMEALGQSRED